MDNVTTAVGVVETAITGKIFEFASPKLLGEHFHDHRLEFGFSTKMEYQNAASNFMSKQPTESTITGWRDSEWGARMGDFVRYDRATNEFGIMSKNGNIRTYYKPKRGLDYALEQFSHPK